MGDDESGIMSEAEMNNILKGGKPGEPVDMDPEKKGPDPVHAETPKSVDERVAELEKANAGLIGDLQTERSRRQSAEGRYGDVDARIAQLEEEKRTAPKEDDDVPVTMAQLREVAGKLHEENRYLVSGIQARDEHTDYAEVVKAFSAQLSNNPTIMERIHNSTNPAEALYQEAAKLKDEADAVTAAEERGRQEVLSLLKQQDGQTATLGAEGADGGKKVEETPGIPDNIDEILVNPEIFDKLPQNLQDLLLKG